VNNAFADSACAAQKLTAAPAAMGDWTLETINRYDAAKGFMLLPRRWVGARTLAWSNQNRRLARRLRGNPPPPRHGSHRQAQATLTKVGTAVSNCADSEVKL
jgi:transposase